MRPPTSWRAVPRAAEVGAMEIGPVPAPRAFRRRTTPPLMLRPPVQPALATGRTSVPAPFLARTLPAAEKTNGFAIVSVLPRETSSALVAALRLSWRFSVKLPVTPKPKAEVPPLAAMVMLLPTSPRAASALTVRRPFWMSTVCPAPPKVLTPLRTSAPAPSLTSA